MNETERVLDGEPAGGIADGVRRQLDPAHIKVSTIGGLFSAGSIGVIFLLLVVVSFISGHPPGLLVAAGAALALTLVLLWLSFRWPRWEYRHAAYCVTPVGIDIWKGVLWRSVTTVPRSRVQHTDVAQGPLQRKYGVATLHVHTAGTEQANVELPGLTHATALAIRDYLIDGSEADVV